METILRGKEAFLHWNSFVSRYCRVIVVGFATHLDNLGRLLRGQVTFGGLDRGNGLRLAAVEASGRFTPHSISRNGRGHFGNIRSKGRISETSFHQLRAWGCLVQAFVRVVVSLILVRFWWRGRVLICQDLSWMIKGTVVAMMLPDWKLVVLKRIVGKVLNGHSRCCCCCGCGCCRGCGGGCYFRFWTGGLGHGGSFDQECGRFRLAPEIKFGQKVVRKIKVVFRFCSCTVGGFLFVDVVVVHVVVAVVVVVGDVRHRCGLKLQRTQTIQKKKKKKENDEKQV